MRCVRIANPETLAVLDTQERNEDQKSGKKPHTHTIQKAKEMINTDPIKNLMQPFSIFLYIKKNIVGDKGADPRQEINFK